MDKNIYFTADINLATALKVCNIECKRVHLEKEQNGKKCVVFDFDNSDDQAREIAKAYFDGCLEILDCRAYALMLQKAKKFLSMMRDSQAKIEDSPI